MYYERVRYHRGSHVLGVDGPQVLGYSSSGTLSTNSFGAGIGSQITSTPVSLSFDSDSLGKGSPTLGSQTSSATSPGRQLSYYGVQEEASPK